MQEGVSASIPVSAAPDEEQARRAVPPSLLQLAEGVAQLGAVRELSECALTFAPMNETALLASPNPAADRYLATVVRSPAGHESSRTSFR